MRAGYFRPIYYHVLRAGLDASGNPTTWHHRIVGQSILTGTPLEAMLVKDGIDATSVEGASNLPYAIPNMLVDLHSPKIGSWRKTRPGACSMPGLMAMCMCSSNCGGG